MHDNHEHHRHTHEAHGDAAKVTPAEPGYPEHPEQRGAAPAVAGAHRHGEHEAHDKHAGHSIGMFRRKFRVSLALTIPTLVWGHMLQGALGYTAPHFGAMWIPPVFGTAVFVYGGWVFIQGAARRYASTYWLAIGARSSYHRFRESTSGNRSAVMLSAATACRRRTHARSNGSP
jgi:cation transport ATPase